MYVVMFLFKWKTTLFGYLCFIVGLVTILVYIFPPFYLSRAIVVMAPASVGRYCITVSSPLLAT